MKFFAKFLSTVLHPLLMPVYVFGYMFYFLPEMVTPIRAEMFPMLLGLVAVSTFMLPGITVLLLHKAGVISEVRIEDRKDRFVPHIISSAIYMATCWLFYSKLSPVPILYILMVSITACMTLVTVINFFWKISAHATALGGITAFLMFAFMGFGFDFLLYSVLIAIVLAGLVMASRLYLQVHTLAQVCAGFILGLSVGLVGLTVIS